MIFSSIFCADNPSICSVSSCFLTSTSQSRPSLLLRYCALQVEPMSWCMQVMQRVPAGYPVSPSDLLLESSLDD